VIGKEICPIFKHLPVLLTQENEILLGDVIYYPTTLLMYYCVQVLTVELPFYKDLQNK